MTKKEEFIKALTDNVKREGIDKLIAWIEKSDFFSAPASTRFHCSHEGGLVEHSLNVFNRLMKHYFFTESNPALTNEETVALMEKITIVSLLHDLCKANFYKMTTRNVKNEDGVWVKEPYYTVEDQLPYGHGEKSVYIITGFMRLTREEAFAIRFHMGDMTDKNTSQVYNMFELAINLHVADLQATYLDEVTRNEKE